MLNVPGDQLQVDLSTSRLADKVKGAVSQNLYKIANDALANEFSREGFSQPVAVANVPEYKACSFCTKSTWWIIGIIAVLFLVA